MCYFVKNCEIIATIIELSSHINAPPIAPVIRPKGQ